MIVHWLYYTSTLEEKMVQVLDYKSQLFAEAVADNDGLDDIGASLEAISKDWREEK